MPALSIKQKLSLVLALAISFHLIRVDADSNICAVDLGSKAAKILVGRFANGKFEIVYPVNSEQKKKSRIEVSVGDDVKQKGDPISPGKIEKIGQIFSEFSRLCQDPQFNVKRIVGVATAAYRNTDDSSRSQVVALAQRNGINLQVISAEREGELGFMAATLGQKGKIVVDLGSKSFQISHKGNQFFTQSWDLGYRVFFESLYENAQGLKSPREAQQKRLQEEFASVGVLKESEALLLNAGLNVLSLIENQWIENNEDHLVIDRGRLHQKLHEIENNPQLFAQIKKWKVEKGDPCDGDSCLVNAISLDTILDVTGLDSAEPTNRGLFHGLIWEMSQDSN